MDKNKKFYTRDEEAGNIIEGFDTYEEALSAIEKYENEDKKDGTFTENFYEIKEIAE